MNNPEPAAAKWVTKRPAGRGGESEFRVPVERDLAIFIREFPDSAQLDPPGTVYNRLIRVACRSWVPHLFLIPNVYTRKLKLTEATSINKPQHPPTPPSSILLGLDS